MVLKEELKKYFGFEKFKGQQENIIKDLLNGNNVFVLMPTGGGKSLCYQLPALISDGLAIVVSPLIALMKNQVDFIRGISENSAIAHVLNSSLNKTEIRKVISDVNSGITKLLYMAPESLTKQEYIDFLTTQNISFFAIDEVHCISEWGHDFRPEYRNLESITKKIKNAPIIALTATATRKVQDDIQKNLKISNAIVYKDSFNRPNLFYEVRPKIDVDKQIVKFIKEEANKSGIIYCLSRKKVEEVAKILQINSLKSVAYHAGLDAKTRAKHQDMFLMEEIDVVVATIAFGMGIDKPDVRFVIHYDMPKSLESYYQETGRAGRDGGQGHCLAFYDYKDIEKLEKFLSSKPLSEREIGMQLLNEMVAYAETSGSRRKFILHYFGEEFDEINGKGAKMDDNMRNPKEKINVQNELTSLLKVIKQTNEILKTKELTDILTGDKTPIIKSYKIDQQPFFGIGKNNDKHFWTALTRQALVNFYLKKEIESYGVIKILEKGKLFLKEPHPFTIPKNHNYADLKSKSNTSVQKTIPPVDLLLFKSLKDLCDKIALKNKIPPYTVFNEFSLNDMVMQYPTTLEEMKDIYGVGEGKAKKFGKPFVEFIAKYVKEHNIERPKDLVVKIPINNSSHKVYIIQNVDRKLSLNDIAKNKGLDMEELIGEMESIVYQGTKLNIDYYLNDILDEDQQDEIFQYFMEAETDRIKDAYLEFDEEFSDEELRLMRIKFLSQVAN